TRELRGALRGAGHAAGDTRRDGDDRRLHGRPGAARLPGRHLPVPARRHRLPAPPRAAAVAAAQRRIAAGHLAGVPQGLHGGPAERHAVARPAAAGDVRRMNEALTYFAMAWLDPQLLLLTAAGTFAGIYVGAIPGLSV